MKNLKSFRISNFTENALNDMAKGLDLNNTEVLERAVRIMYALYNTTNDDVLNSNIQIRQLKSIWM